MTGVPLALAFTVKLSCFAASCVVSALVSVYALTAAAMLVATSLAVTPPVLLMETSPSTSARETFVPARILRSVMPVSSCSPVDPVLLFSVSCF